MGADQRILTRCSSTREPERRDTAKVSCFPLLNRLFSPKSEGERGIYSVGSGREKRKPNHGYANPLCTPHTVNSF